MGVTIRKRDGAWWVFVHHKSCACQKEDKCTHKTRKAKRIGEGDAGKKAATIVAGKIQARLALGKFGIPEAADLGSVPTFAQVAKDWERVTAPNWKRGTQLTYADALRSRISPTFKDLPITAVTPERVEAWWTAMREAGLSRKRLGILRVIVRGICRRAIRQGQLQANPVEGIEGGLGRGDAEVRKVDYLNPEDLTAMLAAAERVTPKESPIFLVMATAGVRLGEAVGLQVGDLDGPGQRIHIRRTVRRGYISSPKTGKGRVVDLPASTVAVLETLRQTRQAEAAYLGTEARWLFPGQVEGMPLTPEQVQLAFRKALRAAGIRKVRPHDLRHTYATLAIQAGVPLLTVSRQLGHASISTTADIDAHAVPGSNRAAAEALEAVLKGNQTHPPRNLPS